MTVDKYEARCYHVLPTVYDDSLSYYESICQLVSKINELVDVINNVNASILDDAKSYTDSVIIELKNEVTQAVKDVEEMEKELIYTTTSQLDSFDSRLVEMSNRINDIVYSVNARTDLVIQLNNEYIFKEINNNILGNITVTNFFTGQKISVQDMFNYLASLHLETKLTYNDLVAKNITVNELKNKGLTYTNLIINGATLL